MALINGRDDFNDQLFNKKTSVSIGTDIFSLGHDYFKIKTNLNKREIRDLESTIDSFSEPITIDDLSPDKNITLSIETASDVMILNFDKGDLTKHSYFGSLQDNIGNNIAGIINTFPASLYVNNIVNSVLLTVLNYAYDDIRKTATFRVPLNAVTNNYGIITAVTSDTLLISQIDNIRNLTSSFLKYSLWNLTDEFNIIAYQGNTVTDNYIYLTVEGNPFPDLDGNSGIKIFHIKPNNDYYTLFLQNLNDFQAYLLNRDNTPKYNAIFKVPTEDSAGNILLVDQVFIWKTTDGYNLDYNTFEFEVFYNSLIKLASSYDDYKTNLISRYLTTSSIKEFDTEDQKVDKLLKIYGREFDEIKKYIDGLADLCKTTYDKKDNMPDVLVKNFAKTLGWGVFNSVSEDDLMKSFLGQKSDITFSGQSKNKTPIEADIELWRRLVINSAFLFRSKGTRNCIDFIFRIIGAPKSLIDFNEYIYIAQNTIDVDNILNNDDLNLPFDTNGYPKVLDNTSDYYFQMKGGWISNVEIAPNNDKNYLSVIGIHTGIYDHGSSYFKKFTDFNGVSGFDLLRVDDNKKTKSIDTSDAHKLVLNSKEMSIFLNPTKVVEDDVYEYNKKYNYVINPTSLPYPYPDNELTRGDVTKMSFLEYMDFIYTNYINVKNRKVIETHGNGYPTLKKLYDDYMTVTGLSVFSTKFGREFGNDTTRRPSKRITPSKVMKYVEQIGDFWINLMEQFIPSTTIWQGGVLYKNTIFDRQKYDYKHGINDGSEFELEQPLPTDIRVNGATIKGILNPAYIIDIDDIAEINAIVSSSINFPDDDPQDTPTPDFINVSNILRVKSSPNSDYIIFDTPCITADKVAKIDLGEVAPVIHNISLSLKMIDFILGCNVAIFNNGGIFRYKLYKYSKTSATFLPDIQYSKEFSNLTPVSGLITINDTITASLTDGDFLVKPSFKVILDITNHEAILDFYTIASQLGINFTRGFKFENGHIIYDSELVENTGELGIYNEITDYWFNIISNPNKPVIALADFEPIDLSSAKFINIQLPITTAGQTVFTLNDYPSGDLILNLNGNTLLKSESSSFADNGDYYFDITAIIPTVTLRPNNGLKLNDVLNVIYLKVDGTDLNTITQVITTIPSGTVGLGGNGIYFNTGTNKYEFYLDFNLDTDVDYDNLIVALNGNKLLKNTDYFDPSTSPFNRIVFNGVIQVGDSILIYYPSSLSNEANYYLATKRFTASWKVSTSGATGIFTVEVSDDQLFSNIVLSATTPYISNNTIEITTYTLYVGDITTPNKKYYYRIKSDKDNINLLGENHVTTVYSVAQIFLTDNRVLG